MLVLPLTTKAQILVNYSLDQNISLNLPTDIVTNDTLGQRAINAQVGDNFIIVTKPLKKDTLVTVENENDLIKFYNGAKKGFVKSSKGEIVEEKIITIENLKLLKLKVKAAVLGNMYMTSYMLFLDNYLYSIQFVSPEQIHPLESEIISSIKFKNGLNLENQLNKYPESSRAYKLGKSSPYLIIPIILGIVAWINYRKRRKIVKRYTSPNSSQAQ